MSTEIPFITGYFGCRCAPFSTWAECKAAHKRTYIPGERVKHRCQRTEGREECIAFDYGIGIVTEKTDDNGHCLVKWENGHPHPGGESAHAAMLRPAREGE